jgi:hypothetical protein
VVRPSVDHDSAAALPRTGRSQICKGRYCSAVRVIGSVAVIIAAGLLVVACTPGPAPTVGTEATTSPENLANGPNPPPGAALRVDLITLSEDGRTVMIQFVGGKDYDPDDPCSNHYFGWARDIDGVLQVKVVDDTPPFPPLPEGFACDAIGYGRTIAIELDEPFLGDRAQDLAGPIHLFRPPAGLVDLPLPAGWTLQNNGQDVGAPPLQWSRRWTLDGTEGTEDTGQVVLQQRFGGPSSTTGGGEVQEVLVNGTEARLFREPESGELVLVWMSDGDGLALVANEADFPVDQLVELAEGVTRP